ncbi:hypothetical protein LTR85_007462 [Meristemomyces frigidus]|nr:hypothetical protein LTR85_007462 [Meristemomyces frigidus]
MAPCLEDCPNEILEAIVILLDLVGICSLRRTCRSMAASATQSHFKSFFLSKRVELEEGELRLFAGATQSGGLGCLIQELSLVELAISVSESNLVARDDPTEVSRLLTQAFSGLAAGSKTGKLNTLLLEVAVVQSDTEARLPPAAVPSGNWRCVWRAAASTFDVAWRALVASRLPIQSLNVFNGPQLHRCSLGSNHLGSIDWRDPGVAESRANMKSLSISLSNRTVEMYEDNTEQENESVKEYGESEDSGQRDMEDMRAEAEAECNFSGLANLLRVCPRLDSLEVHYFTLRNRPLTDVEAHHERLLQSVVELDSCRS